MTAFTQNLDWETIKFISIFLGILLVFIIVVMRAFYFLLMRQDPIKSVDPVTIPYRNLMKLLNKEKMKAKSEGLS
jgi:hypothetical protein